MRSGWKSVVWAQSPSPEVWVIRGPRWSPPGAGWAHCRLWASHLSSARAGLGDWRRVCDRLCWPEVGNAVCSKCRQKWGQWLRQQMNLGQKSRTRRNALWFIQMRPVVFSSAFWHFPTDFGDWFADEALQKTIKGEKQPWRYTCWWPPQTPTISRT